MRYYSTQRPLGPGTYPARTYHFDNVVNFPEKTFVEEIGREAWGYLDFHCCLPDEEIKAWELTPAGMKLWYAVTTSFDDRGRVAAAITDVKECAEKPENRSVSTRRKDIYIDWFATREEAEQFVKEARTC